MKFTGVYRSHFWGLEFTPKDNLPKELLRARDGKFTSTHKQECEGNEGKNCEFEYESSMGGDENWSGIKIISDHITFLD